MTGGTLLQVAFIVMKIAGVIEWPWFWVLAPMWIGAIVAATIIVLRLMAGPK